MRKAFRFGIGTLCALILLAISANGEAQPLATSLRQLSLLVGERIEVTRQDGSVVTGRLTEASDSALRVRGKTETTTLPGRHIRDVTRWVEDSRANGVAIGGVIGGSTVTVSLIVWSRLADIGGNVGTAAAFYGAVGAGIGMGIGAAIDSAIYRKTVVFRGPATPVGVAPILSRNRKGLALTVCF